MLAFPLMHAKRLRGTKRPTPAQQEAFQPPSSQPSPSQLSTQPSQITLSSQWSDTPTLVEHKPSAQMAETTITESGVERPVSFGIGGAGNLRRMSEREKAQEALKELTETNTRANAEAGSPPTTTTTTERRRSSIWSLNSNEGGTTGSKRDAILNIFRRESKSDEHDVAVAGETIRE